MNLTLRAIRRFFPAIIAPLLGLAAPQAAKAQLAPGQLNGLTVTEGLQTKHLAVENLDGRIVLPAVFTQPAGFDTMKVRPVVVMVHGSGPCDMDETVGPNKPFRDLAHALAKEGIASLRYDKRTRVYGTKTEEQGGPLTYDTECVDDACAAIRLARKHGTKVYVLGHSLGGTLAPRIAERSTAPVDGLIFMAGMARPFNEVLREQLDYLATFTPTLDPERVMKQMESALPETYRRSQALYDPLATATALGQMHVLVLQGGHDYQVTKADYDLWRRAFAKNKLARFSFIPDLDHLLRRLPAKAVPADYLKPLPLAADAVTEIVEFVKQ